MEHRELGESGLKVSAVCLGTMTFGEQNSAAEAHSQLDLAFERGVNFIDTAEMYPVPARAPTSGASESIVGAWLRNKPRDKILVATKAAGPARNLSWIRGGPLAFDAANLRAALEASLRRLGTDYVDLYQLHWPARNQPMFGQWQYDPARERPATPIREQLEALATLVDEGKVRAIGLSNEHPWGIAEFVRLAGELGLPRVVSVQNAYSLLNRTYEFGLAELCHRERVSLLAYSPLAFGHLSAKYLTDPDAKGRINLFKDFGIRYTKPNVGEAAQAYAALARQSGVSPATLALAFVYRRWFVASTIIGATSMAQLAENLEAWDWRPEPAVLEEIERIHLRFPNPAP